MPLELNLEIDNRSEVELDAAVYEKVEEYILITLQQENVLVPCEISFSLVVPEEIKELNAEYRGIDKETDVLSFPMLEFPEDEDMITYETGIPVMLGDIVISTTRAAEQAKEELLDQAPEEMAKKLDDVVLSCPDMPLTNEPLTLSVIYPKETIHGDFDGRRLTVFQLRGREKCADV